MLIEQSAELFTATLQLQVSLGHLLLLQLKGVSGNKFGAVWGGSVVFFCKYLKLVRKCINLLLCL